MGPVDLAPRRFLVTIVDRSFSGVGVEVEAKLQKKNNKMGVQEVETGPLSLKAWL